MAPRPGLIWGFALGAGGARPIERIDESSDEFRWLHLNLADQGTRHWIAHAAGFPADVRDLLLSAETHQRALIEGGAIGCALHDLERDFDVVDTTRVGVLRVALTAGLIVTARHHPLRSADLIRDRLMRAPAITQPGAALDLLVGTISGLVARITRDLSAAVQHAEDSFLDDLDAPLTRDLIGIRRRLAQLHRLADGMRAVFIRLEQDDDLPEFLLSVVERLSQQLAALDGDIAAVQVQLRLLREELDLQAAQRTNTNLYVLSIMTALMLPATLVTGIIRMNTGGLPFAGMPAGTFAATLLALAAAAGTYLMLRAMGLMRR
ncbi:magnesium transporter CorA [Sphingomonas solaris]|uniref:Magnesium transporter CorA n=1 Tax=Alterirhizorhabdus solaris TaxID=2529389 RepID=A0A558RBJ9_9SPHN|nr:magnesium transporter CorA [Sphingomonas solaris]